MKTFLLFVSGMLTALALILVAALLFWKSSSFAPTALNNVPKAVSPFNDLNDQIAVSGTINMPPAIRIYKPGEGRFVLYFSYGASFEKRLPIDYVRSGVKFPRKFKVNLSRKKLAEVLSESQGHYYLLGYYAPAKTGMIGRSFVYAEPTAVLWELGRAQLDPKANSIDLGTLNFGAVWPQAAYEKCLSDKVLLQGKILPPPSSDKRFAGKKLALVVYPENQDISWLPASAGPAEFDRLVLHTQFLDFANGPVSFSWPWRDIPSSLLRLAVVMCEPNEDLKSCSLLAFPPMRAAQNTQRVLGLVNKHLEKPVCGDTDYTAIFPSAISN